MRVYAIWMLALFLCLFAWKDWFKALCMLVVMMAIVERPDMPQRAFGISGFNPWNLIFVNIILSWYVAKISKENMPDFAISIRFFLGWYVGIILISFLREIWDLRELHEFEIYAGIIPSSIGNLFLEDVLNTIKYMIPGILMYYGCNSYSRYNWAMVSILLLILLLALQVIKVMPISALTDGYTLEQVAIRKLDRDIGYHRSDLSILLGGGAWAIYCYRINLKPALAFCISSSGWILTSFAVALTGGRIGACGWVATAAILGIVKWRRFFLLAPFVALIVTIAVPAVTDRITQGFNKESSDETILMPEEGADITSVTSGRSIVWPYVIDKILESPYLGYGRKAMVKTGLALWFHVEYGDSFPHPHNAYLELLLDNGLILAIPILVFFFLLVKWSIEILLDSTNEVYMSCGSVALAFIVSTLTGYIGLQSFYPSPASVGMWCVIGIVLRVVRERTLTEDSGNDYFLEEYSVSKVSVPPIQTSKQ